MREIRPPIFSIVILLLIAVITFVAPYIYGVSPYEFNKDAILQAPSLAHPFGTELGGLEEDPYFGPSYEGGTSLNINWGGLCNYSSVNLG